MADNDNFIKLLKSQRNAIKGQLNNFKTFLENYKKETDFVQLQLRLQKISSLFEKFDSICDQLDTLDESEESINKRFLILNKYYAITSAAQERISEVCMQQNATTLNRTVSASGSVNEEGTSSSGSKRNKLKLPYSAVPNFGGRLDQWLSFKNSFLSMIDSRDDITNSEKLHYLKSALQNEALRKIQVLPISDENYTHAWEILNKAYENKRLLISQHLSLLLNLPCQEKDNHKSIEFLADELQQHVKSLEILKVNISHEIVVQIIHEKLNQDTRRKWEDSLSRNEFPSLDQLIEFLYKTAVNLSQDKKRIHSNSCNEGSSAKFRKLEYKGVAKSFITTNKKCPACSNEGHPLFKCEKFRELSVTQRIKIVKDANLCFNCLRNHGKIECRFGNCRICNKKHNSLLHFSKNEKINEKNSKNSE